ncbi:hypothetical protein pb186bvf_006445 [Paramecium bursaria]
MQIKNHITSQAKGLYYSFIIIVNQQKSPVINILLKCKQVDELNCHSMVKPQSIISNRKKFKNIS